jgi:hypothetical protein
VNKQKETTDRYTFADLEKWSEVAREIDPPIRLGVFGDPVAHSLSPQMQNAALRACEINLQYARFHIRPNELRSALRVLRELDFVGANLTVPIFSVVLRKAYGLGAQGMVGGSFHLPMFSVAWPTGEFGPMNLEGAVKLGFRKELEAITDPAQRKARFAEMVAEAYERGKALSAATMFEIDDVIDPADTRSWIMAGLRSLPSTEPRTGKKRACVDTW